MFTAIINKDNETIIIILFILLQPNLKKQPLCATRCVFMMDSSHNFYLTMVIYYLTLQTN